jgi:hypothetical protein
MTQLPANLASRQRRSVIADAAVGLGSPRPAHLSIKGGRFRLVSATGIETVLDTHNVDIVVVDASNKTSRVYYENDYVQDSNDPPVCFSDNGTGPSTQSIAPQSPTCAVCPHNVRGSDTTFTGKPTTACENRKKLAFIIPDDPAVNVYEFQVPPGSLSGLKAYADWLGKQASGVQGRALDIADVVTRVQFDPDRPFVMQFSAVAFADDDRTMQLIDYIDANKLADIAVGRNDVARAPEEVKAMLAGRPAAPALPAPAAPAPTQFQLPPREPPAALSPPAAAPAAPTPEVPPKRRGRQAAAAPTQAPQQFMAPAAAPFQPAAPPAPIAQSGDLGIPDFLRRDNGVGQPPAPSAPRFGVGAAPPPPAAVADALASAMALPTRR